MTTPDSDGYHLVCAAAELFHEQLRTVAIAGEKVIVTKLGEELRAFAAACPHASGDLSRSTIYRGRIDCPEHGYRFDIHTGRVLWPPDELCRLRRYDVIEAEGKVWVRLSRQGLS